MKRILIILSLPLLLAGLLSSTVQATGPQQPQALVAYQVLSGTSYIADDVQGTEIGDTIEVPVKFNSNTHTISYFNMKLKWNSSKLTYIGAQATANWPSGVSFTPITTSNSFYVVASGISPADSFSVNEVLFYIKLRIDCIDDDAAIGDEVYFNPTGADTNSLVSNGTPYNPASHLSSAVSIPSHQAFVWITSDTTIIDEQPGISVFCSLSFAATGGYGLRLDYNGTKLDYGTAYGYGQFTVTDSAPGTANSRLIFTGTSTIPASSKIEILYILFTNTMNNNHDTSLITLRTSGTTFKTTCNQAEAVPGAAQGKVTTLYTAKSDLEEESTPVSSTDTLDLLLTNTFSVFMGSATDLERASFRVRTNNWTRATYSVIANTNANYNWEATPRNGTQWTYESPTAVSQNISQSSSPVSVVGYKYTTGSTAGAPEAANFYAEQNPDSTATYKLDNKLTDATRHSIKIYSVHNDSDLVLVSGSIQVTSGGGSPPGGSCPFVYVWNGSTFEEDDVVLTQTEFSPKGVAVTDHYMLTKHLEVKDNFYRLQVRELVDEKSFIDQLELLTIDHPSDKKVGVSSDGNMFYIDEELIPTSAVDQHSNEQIEKLSSKDDAYFVADGSGYLTLTFQTSRKGKLVFGGPAPAKLPDDCNIDSPGPDSGGGPDPGGWFTKIEEPKEVDILNVQVENAEGYWIDLPSQAARENNALGYWVIEPEQVQVNGTFRVKLSWNKGYKADVIRLYVAGEGRPENGTLALASAYHSKLGTCLNQLSSADNVYSTLIKGEMLDLYFPANNLPLPEGYTREFVVKASGYYIPFKSEEAAATPTSFQLFDNYPNPFNAQTEIRYNLPTNTKAELAIFNTLGQKVRTLVNEEKAAGTHSVIWDGRNESGQTVASGVYFYALRAGTYTETKKMTLLK